MYTFSKTIDELGNYDVIVVGAGSAGATAAIAAGRQGAKTLLVDRNSFLGGTSTAVLDTFYGFYTPGTQSKKVVGGIADEVVARLTKFAMAFERPNTFGAGTGITYHPDYLKVVWEAMVLEAKVEPLLYAFVQDTLLDGENVRGIVLATKGGLAVAYGKSIVDASGDAEVCRYAGLPFEAAGEAEAAQTLTTTFKMVNVDLDRRKAVTKDEIKALMDEAAEKHGYHLPRRGGSDHRTPVTGMIATIMTRLPGSIRKDARVVNATDPRFLSRSEMEGRTQALEYIRFLVDQVPGYERAQLSGFSSSIGVRETRRIYGHYRLTESDVLEAKKFEDQIGLCGAPVEDHHEGTDTAWHYLPDGECVGIPYRTLLPEGAHNVIVAGRCFSANHTAQAAVRSMAQCMAMGHAAGVAAAMSADVGWQVDAVPVAALQQVLRSDGAILDLP